MAPHSSTLAWKIPWIEEPGRLQSMGSWRVRHDWATSLHLRQFYLQFFKESPHMDYCWPGTSVHGDYPGKNTGVSCHGLLHRIFPIQGLHPALLHCGRILYCLNHQGSLRILEWVAYPFFRVTSWPRNWTGVSCIVGGSLPAELPEKPIYLCIYNGEIS